jgi:sugar O-acyltransferase (sialic acid O-acetyltransferase NeuD family)
MRTEILHLVGAGGHARVVIDALIRSGVSRDQLMVWTESADQVGTEISEIGVGMLQANSLQACRFHVCIGDNAARQRLHATLCAAGATAKSVIHPAATIAGDARIGAGSFVAAGAIIGPNAELGAACIVNHGAIVDHDCNLADFAHIAPGATLAGTVRIGEGVLVGAGANLLPGVSVAERAIIGAGAVVLKDIPADSVSIGIPARRIR